jgi:glycosyltransferase involved in cell wall biosynthesis
VSLPLISCIVPAYNAERYLAEAIDSILAQTYPHTQIIVVDDGSTDGTADVVARYGGRIEGHRQPNGGTSAARNRGIAAACGEFLAFLDADDLWHPEKLARQAARFEASPELTVSLTHIQNFWVAGLEAEAARFKEHPRNGPVPGYSPVTMLARRAVFEQTGDFTDGLAFADSLDWFLRLREQGIGVEMLDDVLVYRRMHHANKTRSFRESDRDEFLKLVKASLDRRRAR